MVGGTTVTVVTGGDTRTFDLNAGEANEFLAGRPTAISADQPRPGTSGPHDLEIGGHSTGAGHET